MSETTKTPILFWIISVIALLWNAMGVMAYLGSTQYTVEMAREAYGQAYADMFVAKPAWATAAFAIAVFAGLLGSICLLLRKKWATPIFVISLIGVIVHDIWGFMVGSFSVVSTVDKVMTALVVVIAIFLIWFARKKTAIGILR